MGIKHGLTLREEHRLKVFDNMMISRICGQKREKVVEGWRRLHNEELHNLYGSQNVIRVIISRRMRLVGQVACMGKMKNVYSILVGKSEGKRPLVRPRHRQEGNIRINLGEIVWEAVDWIYLAQGRNE
jgi:hypothetical protein